jgi:CRP-like cAMP-binding protein
MKTKQSTKRKKESSPFDTEAFRHPTGVARPEVLFRKTEKLFSQGDPCNNISVPLRGGVKISVVCPSGKEAVVGIMAR